MTEKLVVGVYLDVDNKTIRAKADVPPDVIPLVYMFLEHEQNILLEQMKGDTMVGWNDKK